MHNDHGQFDTRSPLKNADLGVRAKPKWPLLAAAGVGGAVVGWFIPLGLIESVTTATGLSEMVPALAPPLGDTMRMLLALGGGVSALALAAVFLGGRPKSGAQRAARPLQSADDHRAVPEGVLLQPNARADLAPNYAPNLQSFQRDNGETPMARHAPLARHKVRDFNTEEALNDGSESGGFFSRMKASLSKLPLPRRFADDGDADGPIRDFSDLKRLRPGGDDRRDGVARAETPVRPIAAHAELGAPLPPLKLETVTLAPIGQHDQGDDLAELERSARAASDRFAAANAPLASTPSRALPPQTPEMVAPQATPANTPATSPGHVNHTPVRYDAEGIDALVARLEQALAHVRPMAVAAPVAVPELDLTALNEAQQSAEEARLLEERRAEEARQAQIAAEAEAKRRADALAAQGAARKAAEAADRAAEEARRRAEDAQALLASLGVEQAAPLQVMTAAPTPLRAVEPSPIAAAEPEMDDALRSALRTLRRMSNP